MGFDELNVVQSPTATSGGGGGGGAATPNVDIPKIEMPSFDDFNASLEDSKKKIEGLLVLIGLVGVGLAGWKIANLLEEIKNFDYYYQSIFKKREIELKLKNLLGVILTIGGAILTVKGYTDAWANDVSWTNLAETLGGIVMIVGGLYL